MTVTLPIESEDYDRVIRQLDGLAIGSAKWRDCGFVTVIQAKYPPKQRENARRNDKKPIEGKPESDAPHVKT